MTTIAKKTAKDPVIVVLQLSGGNDYLNTIVPYNSSEYRDYSPIVTSTASLVAWPIHPEIIPIKLLLMFPVKHFVG